MKFLTARFYQFLAADIKSLIISALALIILETSPKVPILAIYFYNLWYFSSLSFWQKPPRTMIVLRQISPIYVFHMQNKIFS